MTIYGCHLVLDIIVLWSLLSTVSSGHHKSILAHFCIYLCCQVVKDRFGCLFFWRLHTWRTIQGLFCMDEGQRSLFLWIFLVFWKFQQFSMPTDGWLLRNPLNHLVSVITRMQWLLHVENEEQLAVIILVTLEWRSQNHLMLNNRSFIHNKIFKTLHSRMKNNTLKNAQNKVKTLRYLGS